MLEHQCKVFMDPIDILLHLLNFLAPALGVALLAAVLVSRTFDEVVSENEEIGIHALATTVLVSPVTFPFAV